MHDILSALFSTPPIVLQMISRTRREAAHSAGRAGVAMPGFYEFFSGGGMARAGLGDHWNCLFANDFCPKKATSYVTNWGDKNFVLADISKVAATEIPGHADLAWASFPCQDLSLAGNQAGLAGERSGVFWAFMRHIRSLAKAHRKPRIIVLENVYGALTSNDGNDADAVLSALLSVGYCVGAMVIDAVHFLPQSRPRFFVVAVDCSLNLPCEVHSPLPSPAWHPRAVIAAHNRMPEKLQERWKWWHLPQPVERVRMLSEVIEASPKGVSWHAPEETARIIEMMSPLNRRKVMQAQASGTLQIGAIYRRTRQGQQRAEVRFDGLSGCLRTPAGGSSRQTIMIVNGTSIRTRLLSPREAARLMGLPDTYVLPDRYNEAYGLAGDGVAVPVVRHLAASLLEPIIAFNRREALSAA